MPIWSMADKYTFTNSLLLRKTQSTKIFLHKYCIKFCCAAIKSAVFLAVSQNLSLSARKSRHFLATVLFQSSSAIKKPEFLAAIQTSSSMARNKPVFLASS